jgi:O-antigen/teichoic acid export membrane protein
MAVSLYTSRIVLTTLGVSDFGVYSIVGGIVSSFGFINASMANATQRFLSFALGENDFVKLKNTFSASLTLHLFMAIVFLILAETVGLWFLNTKLVIQQDRLFAANVVFHLSVLTFVVGIIQVPYNALLIAKEKMDVFAYMSIFEVFLKLVIVFLLPIIVYDHLIVYAGLYLLVSVIIRISYKMYCTRNFEESRYVFYYDKPLFKKLLSFSGWTMFGSMGVIAKNQGINVLLNIFFGTVLNAACGITMQVLSAVSIFLINLQVAFRPQIIMNYANGNISNFQDIVYKSSKFSYFLMLVIICPLLLNLEFVLKLWLTIVPDYVVLFVTLSLISLLIDSVSEPLIIANQATGNVKWFQIIEGTLIILNVPISYVLLKINANPLTVFYVSMVLNSIALFARIALVRKVIDVKQFFVVTLFRVFLVSALVFSVVYFVRISMGNSITFFAFITQSSIVFFSSIVFILLLGIESSERTMLTNFVKGKIAQFKNKAT